MIYYVSHRAHPYTLAVILLWYGEKLRPLFRFVSYDTIGLLRKAGPGVVIWTDFDRLTSAELMAADRVRAELMRNDLIHLNGPRKSEQRFDMLARLYREGVNNFDVRRPYDSLDGLRYPVFLRDEVGATYVVPELLPDRAALDSAIAALPKAKMVRPMVVEFGAKPGADGYFRKYGAYRVGGRIFPQHCLIHPHWFVKHTGPLAPEHRAEHRAYVDENPHAEMLRPLFEATRIEYGRIDYTTVDGRFQVFEINTNPAVLSSPPKPSDGYDQRPYAERHIEALLDLPNAALLATHFEINSMHQWRLRQLQEQYGAPEVPDVLDGLVFATGNSLSFDLK